MVAISGFEDGLFCVAWNGPGLIEWGLTVVCLPGGVTVQFLKVYGSFERPVLLGADHHAVAPSVWGAQGDLFQDSKPDVTVEAGFHLILPVDGDGNGCVGMALGLILRLNGGLTSWGGLVLTNVKHTGCLKVTQVLLELAKPWYMY